MNINIADRIVLRCSSSESRSPKLLSFIIHQAHRFMAAIYRSSRVLLVESSHLERALHLAGQNMTTSTVDKLRVQLEEAFHTDEYFLDEVEPFLVAHWEELTDDQIGALLVESFEAFDSDQRGSIDRRELVQCLTSLGDMPLTMKDAQLMCSLADDGSNKASTTFDYRSFVKRLCGSERMTKQRKKKKKRTLKKAI